jgi:hypothetical protein
MTSSDELRIGISGWRYAGEESFMQRICRSGAPLLNLNVLSGDATEID